MLETFCIAFRKRCNFLMIYFVVFATSLGLIINYFKNKFGISNKSLYIYIRLRNTNYLFNKLKKIITWITKISKKKLLLLLQIK